MDECITLAKEFGKPFQAELSVPVYFYEDAALKLGRSRLEVIRVDHEKADLYRVLELIRMESSPRAVGGIRADGAEHDREAGSPDSAGCDPYFHGGLHRSRGIHGNPDGYVDFLVNEMLLARRFL